MPFHDLGFVASLRRWASPVLVGVGLLSAGAVAWSAQAALITTTGTLVHAVGAQPVQGGGRLNAAPPAVHSTAGGRV